MITAESQIPIKQVSEKSTEKRKHRKFLNAYARQWMTGWLMLTDVVCAFIALLLALQLHWFSNVEFSLAYVEIFALFCLILLIKFYRSGLYPGIGLHYIDELHKLVDGISSTFVIILAVTFVLHTSFIYSRLVIFFTWIFSILLIPFGRYLIRRLLIFLGLWGLPVVVIGNPGKAADLAKKFQISIQHGILPELVICDEDCLAVDSAGAPIRIKECAQRLDLQDAFILIDDLNQVDWLVDRYRFIFHHVTLIKDQVGNYGLNNLQPLDFSTVLGLQIRNNLLSPSSQLFKKLIDKLGAFFGLLLLAPFFGLVALAIQLDNPGRVFYRQTRLGRGGKPFQFLKFRTMYLHADQILKTELARNPEMKAEWDTYQKLKNDPRITRIGRFLRRFSLDELPQLWNVACGEMSLVGPRPIMLAQQPVYGPAYKNYIQVTPGMTGLWQVSGRNQTSFARRAELDNEYIQRWSIWMDIYILAKTIKVVLWRDGAY